MSLYLVDWARIFYLRCHIHVLYIISVTNTHINTFNRLGLMVMGGLTLASFMTYAAEHISVRTFMRGYEERDAQTTRNICSFC